MTSANKQASKRRSEGAEEQASTSNSAADHNGNRNPSFGKMPAPGVKFVMTANSCALRVRALVGCAAQGKKWPPRSKKAEVRSKK
jgi:hypothetical protein